VHYTSSDMRANIRVKDNVYLMNADTF